MIKIADSVQYFFLGCLLVYFMLIKNAKSDLEDYPMLKRSDYTTVNILLGIKTFEEMMRSCVVKKKLSVLWPFQYPVIEKEKDTMLSIFFGNDKEQTLGQSWTSTKTNYWSYNCGKLMSSGVILTGSLETVGQ